MNIKHGALAAAAIASLLACDQPAVTQTGSTEREPEKTAASPKKPLVFDASKILVPPAKPGSEGNPALAKSASTYYTFWAGNQITWDDYNHLCPSGCGAIGSMAEATYAGRFTAYPDDMWFRDHDYRLSSRQLYDNEQAELHFFIPTGSGTPGGFNTRYVSLGWDVSSEAGYDKLYITSTASDGSCNSPGVIRQMASGEASGTLSFSVPGNCGQIWVGVYYIKDYSVSSGNDRVRVIDFHVTH